jgi:hypothetical protein
MWRSGKSPTKLVWLVTDRYRPRASIRPCQFLFGKSYSSSLFTILLSTQSGFLQTKSLKDCRLIPCLLNWVVIVITTKFYPSKIWYIFYNSTYGDILQFRFTIFTTFSQIGPFSNTISHEDWKISSQYNTKMENLITKLREGRPV